MEQEDTLDAKLRLADGVFMQCPNCEALYASSVSFCTADGTKLVKSDSLNARSSIFAEKYEILNQIGSGGMGTVYRVRQILLNKICALKVIPADSVNDVLISRFQREAKMMAALDHANLARILDFGIYQKQPYIVMEYVDGTPLNKLISAGPLKPAEAIEIFLQILEALSHAHKRGVLHRDVKPSNIMILQLNPESVSETSRVQRATLLDFGIAKKFDTTDDAGKESNSKTQALTRTGEMIGSPLYMSPEQARGEKITERSDLYSLGCTLFESLTGTPPLVGKSTVDTLILHMEKPAPCLKEASLGKDFPPGLERVVSTLLAKNPQERYQSADEARRALAISLTSGAELMEPVSFTPQNTLPPLILILLAVSLIGLISLVAYISIQGEKSLRNATLPPADTDTIKLENAALTVAANIFDKTKDGRRSDPNEEENEEDEYDELKARQETEKPISAAKISANEIFLRLRGRTLSEEEVQLIEKNTNLHGLGLMEAKFPHEMIGNLSGNIYVLRLTGTNFRDDDMRGVGKNIYLNKLFINTNPITNAGLKYLQPLKFLSLLDIGGTNVDVGGIRELRHLPSLTELSANNNSDIDDRAAEEISSLIGLRNLQLSHTNVTAKSISQLHHLPVLTHLDLSNNRLTDKDIAGLKKIKSLGSLSLSHNKITSAGLKHLLPLKHLVSLHLDRNPVNDSAVDTLLQMPQMQLLNLSATKLSSNGIMRLAELPHLKEISVKNVADLDETFAHDFLTKCKSCNRFKYLRARGESYDRKEWTLDEGRKQGEHKEFSQKIE